MTTIKPPDRNERRRMMNTLPNQFDSVDLVGKYIWLMENKTKSDLRLAVKAIETIIDKADLSFDCGEVTDGQLSTFFQLVYLSLFEKRTTHAFKSHPTPKEKSPKANTTGADPHQIGPPCP